MEFVKKKIEQRYNHRYLDEAGDTTFFGKGKTNIVGQTGVSSFFLIGMVTFFEPISVIRNNILSLQNQVINDPYINVIPSVQKRINDKGFYFHATDDPPEVRKIFYDFIKTINCKFKVVVLKKSINSYINNFYSNEAELYSHLLSELISNKLLIRKKFVFNIAERGKTTKNKNLFLAFEKAKSRILSSNPKFVVKSKVHFNITNHYDEPILNITDYFCWSVQRVFERKELRYHNYISEKIPLLIYLNNDNSLEEKILFTEVNKLNITDI